MSFEIDIGFTSLAGTKPVNEDFCAAMLPEPGREDMGVIAGVADGVSAGGMGKEAAQTTLTSLVRDYYGTPQTWDTTVALDRIIAAQNSWLTAINRRRNPAMGMTTLTALVLRGHSYSVAHVGDSRAYLLRAGKLIQLTSDHVMPHQDFKHQLLRAVGAQERLVVDYLQGDLQVGDVFVLLTDGVHGTLRTRQITELTQIVDAQQMSQSLVDAALKAGSNDNATAVVVRILGLLDASLQDVNRSAKKLPVPALLQKGDVIDQLEVLELVADNGINLVYQVRDKVIAREYALKTLHPARAHDHEERAMLAHEAWLALCMQSSGAASYLVRLHDRSTSSQKPSSFYLLYDWIAGESLQQMLDRQCAFNPAQTVAIAMRGLKALGRLHRQGVIHRDVKPSNLHMDEEGVLRLLDLGVALSGREPEATRLLHAGTPSYINPEQWGFSVKAGGINTDVAAVPPDTTSDLFALGVTLYQLLTAGKLPYGEVQPYQSGRYYRDPTPPSRHNPEVPIWLDHVVLKAVARDKRLRFETAEEFVLALERGAARPLTAPPATPLIQRDPTMLWKMLLAFSALFNVLLIVWLLFLPKK